MKTGSRFLAFAMGVTTALGLSAGAALAADKVKIAASHKGNWSTFMPVLGDKHGFFKDNNIEVEIVWTHGGSDAQQAIISGAADVALQTGTLGVLSAFEKGAPIRVIAASMTGSGGLYWYVKADSPIKDFAKDAKGKSMGFSRPGSSTNLVAAALNDHFNAGVELRPTGGPTGTLTQVMSGQLDIGWASPPLGLEKIESGEIRVVVRGDESPTIKNQSIRVHVANANWLKNNKDAAKRFMQALWKSHEYGYTPEGMKEYSEFSGIKMNLVKQIAEYSTLENHKFSPVGNLDQTMQEAVQGKRLKKPLTKAQLDELIQIVYKPEMM